MKVPVGAEGRRALRRLSREGCGASMDYRGQRPPLRPGDGIEFTRGGRVVALALVTSVAHPAEHNGHRWVVRMGAVEDLDMELGRGFEPHIMGGYRPETAWRREAAEAAAPKRRARRRR